MTETTPKMRFAFSTAPQRTTWDWVREVWEIAENLDIFESGWTFDHLYPLFGDSTEDCLEGWITLTALMESSKRLRGGVLVTGMVYRHPGVLANMATTLDIISGGRIELGIGAGWNEEECDAFGIELGSMKERFDRFEEGLAVLDSLMNNDRTSFEGTYYQLEEAMNNPKPVQSPVPICIGGVGKKRTLPLTAKYAQHWNHGPDSTKSFAECKAVLAEACQAEGRDISDITCSSLEFWEGADALARHVEEFGEVGCDLTIISLDKSMSPGAIEEVAAAAAALI